MRSWCRSISAKPKRKRRQRANELDAALLPLLFGYLNFNSTFGAVLGAAFWLCMLAGFAMLRWLLPQLNALLPFAPIRHVLSALQRIADKHGKIFLSLLAAMFAPLENPTATKRRFCSL